MKYRIVTFEGRYRIQKQLERGWEFTRKLDFPEGYRKCGSVMAIWEGNEADAISALRGITQQAERDDKAKAEAERVNAGPWEVVE